MKDECGVFGVFGHLEASELCYLGLYALQHRGQESAGIISSDNGEFYVVKDMGLVGEVFDSNRLESLKGTAAIGHVRYSTTGSSHAHNIQPLYAKTAHGKLAIAHNGNLTNAAHLHKILKDDGALFQSTVDTEVLLHIMAQLKTMDFSDRLIQALQKIEGAFSLVGMDEHCLFGVRDPHGFRPLVLGKKDEAFVLASETCALDLIGASYEREIRPGECVIITESGLQSIQYSSIAMPKQCVFEHVYFARPDSIVYNQSVHKVRKAFGRVLANEFPRKADLVIAIPDSGNSAALGYSEASGIPFEFGITRNHYVGRTFIQPTQSVRNFSVRIKLNPVSAILRGKSIVVVDDSLVRGTTAKRRIVALRRAGVKEIHVLISSPPVIAPCHFGIDTPEESQLIANHKTVDEICDYIGADSLGFLSREGMLSAIEGIDSRAFCTACFDANYPIEIKDKGKYSLESDPIHFC